MTFNPADLRAFADWLDAHPAVTDRLVGVFPHITLYSAAEGEWPALLAELGTFDKGESYSGDHLEAIKHFGGSVHLHVQVRKECTCERVQVGERSVERPVLPDGGLTYETVTEPVYEYRCPESWIAPS